MPVEGYPGAYPSADEWAYVTEFPALGHVISNSGSSHPCWRRTRTSMWKSFFGSAGSLRCEQVVRVLQHHIHYHSYCGSVYSQDHVLHIQFRHMYSNTRDSSSTVIHAVIFEDHVAPRPRPRYAHAIFCCVACQIFTSDMYFLA